MLQPIYKRKFEKDVKLAQKRGLNLNKLKAVIHDLIDKKPLNKKFLDHPLKGEYSDCRECHIEPDWLLIYFIEKEFITFVRTGSHADLFG
jgi:mRNA interferase YafQ